MTIPDLDIALVPQGRIHEVLGAVLPYVAKAEGWTLDRVNADDIAAFMLSGVGQTWIVFETESRAIRGYLSTEVRQYLRAKHFVVLNCGGEDGYLDACVHKTFDVFERYARETGCDGMEIQGRRAWGKFIKDRGFAQPYVQYYKNLKGAA